MLPVSHGTSFVNVVDTNVLIYAHDSRAAGKQAAAITLIESLSEGALLWQVACEYLAASRKLQPLGYSWAEAWNDVSDLHRVWTTILLNWHVLERANGLLTNYSLSWWDAMIVAACLEGGVERFYTEDFDAYSQLEGLEIINPFSTSA